jgi:hypothetical protein
VTARHGPRGRQRFTVLTLALTAYLDTTAQYLTVDDDIPPPSSLEALRSAGIPTVDDDTFADAIASPVIGAAACSLCSDTTPGSGRTCNANRPWHTRNDRRVSRDLPGDDRCAWCQAWT